MQQACVVILVAKRDLLSQLLEMKSDFVEAHYKDEKALW